MAEFIQTDELTGSTKPTGAGGIITQEKYGIDAVLQNYIIQNVQITTSRTSDDTYDQKNALVSQLDVDQRWDGSMTVIGGSSEDGTLDNIEVGDTTFTWAEKTWKVTGITYNGTYNDKKTYTIQFFRTVNFPA